MPRVHHRHDTRTRHDDDPLVSLLVLYRSLGWAVFPCRPRRKEPVTPQGCKDATRDGATLNRWLREHPRANWAIATGSISGIWVLDLDAGGEESLAMLEREHGALPTCPMVRTGSGGSHRFFRLPAGVEVRNSVRDLGPGLDVRGEGGYVVAPPSIHPTGGRYLWTRAPRQGEPLPEAPAWIVERVRKREAPKPQREIVERVERRPDLRDRVDRWVHHGAWHEIESVERATEGTRNATLNRAAHALGRYVAGGLLDESEVVARLTDAAAASGLGARETARTIASGLAAGARDPRDRAWVEHHLAVRGRAA